MIDLLSLAPDAARDALAQWLAARGEPAYRAKQIVPRLWQRPAASWDDASDLPTGLRRGLAEAFPLRRLELAARQLSRDGTEKYLWSLGGGEAIESVLIPEGRRRTLCISSQEGCALGCVFCATGRMGFRQNLSAAEITGQVRELMLLDPSLKPTNVVFMGMGEPLLNWDAVDTALTILNHPDGLGIGARHVTVSTVGILPNLARLARRPGADAGVRAAAQGARRGRRAAAEPRARHQRRLRAATGGTRGAAARSPPRGARSRRVAAGRPAPRPRDPCRAPCGSVPRRGCPRAARESASNPAHPRSPARCGR